MSRYRRELTQPDREIARLADETKALRQELQAMVKLRRRGDFHHQAGNRPPPGPRRKKR